MSRLVRAALTETANAYREMPARVSDLGQLAGKLDDLRRANVEHHVALAREAARAGASLICFGELFTAPYFALTVDPMWLALAEDARKGPTVTRLREVARQLAMVIVAPIYELDPSGARFNTAVVIDEKGELLGKYRKTHIPNGRNEQGQFVEGFYYQRSDGRNGRGPANISSTDPFPVFQTSFGRLGIAICYDRHFEGVLSSLAAEGAELVLSPAVTFGNKSERMWPLEFEVEAARQGLYVGGSNRRGSEPPWNQEYFGGSHFVGPEGRLANLSPHPELVLAELDLDLLANPDSSGWNFRRDERPEIHSPKLRARRS